MQEDFPTPNSSFSRLRILVDRGYRPCFRECALDGEFNGLPLRHPRQRKGKVQPALTLWDDGMVTTAGLLWPDRAIETSTEQPEWQRYIQRDDDERFQSFVATIAKPSLIDTLIAPICREARMFGAQLMFGLGLCFVLASGLWLSGHLVMAA